ncbi:DUF3572 domain-containing protein [Sneathiella chinensis]|uniref:DUF3572 domain-containing protein n=1 Tax=Sneathiella chinensis TaxID=349750 RepID=A0ABQ5U8T3_9PROT|nr:DUF3572 domain-containing protein [Sneathiella chinensis]GLQ07674.1 hypothetical protein GCM10007924_28950 [Sneathiella chinensis]
MKNQDLADIICLQAITYLVSDEKKLNWLMNETGITAGDLTELPANPEVFGGTLDFLLNHEDILVDFCEQYEIAPDMPARIRPLFPGAVQDY